jgi:class 3 adenylate cyclase/tetratricopeptide (TPR) repeat protein
MRCQACLSENREGRRYCAGCGAELVVGCPACGSANEPGDRFCGACGTAMAQAAPAAAATPPPATERRTVSVLFADLVGFTVLAGARDPEEVRELLTSYFDAARSAVERHGGTVEKFIGDAVMAVWGAPTSQEDDAERAVRVALELVDAVHALGERTGIELGARAAVATGEAAVTVGAVGQGIVAGDLVNTASRIQGAAEPGSVLVDDATRRMTEAAIVCEAAGTFDLKGKPEPVALWRAMRVSAARRGVGRSAGLDPPFVGRDRELRLLKDVFHATEGGRAHLVSVTGIAGIGKSRLAWEFEKYADGLAGEVLWHRGRCLSYGEGVAFWALAEMVRMRAQIAEDEPVEAAERKLAAAVGEWVHDPADREWVTPPLLHLLGVAAVADADRERLFPAWRRFFEAMAEQLPVVLVFEDMHWADQSLLTFIEYLLEWSRDHRLFVLGLARPELAERRPGWGLTPRSFMSLALEPLPRDAMGDLVAGMVPGLPAEAVAQISAAAEGVPLYAVETARMLLDRGVIVRTGDGGYRMTTAIADLEIPETLHALVAARLDGLSEDERRLVQQAAVLGKTFTLDGLAAVSGLPPEPISETLAGLARRELVAAQTDPRSPDHGQYGFVQDMVRTIARDTLGRRERKRLHLAAADHLTLVGGDELAELIAAHRLDAYRLLPDDPDAAELRETARADILRAADRAASLAAPEEAYRLVTEAMDLVPDGPEQALLHERAGLLALKTGDVAGAEGQYTRALAIHERAGDAHAAARVRARRGDVLFLEGRAEQAVIEMEEAYAVLADGPADADLAHLGAQVGRLCGMIGEEARGRDALERAIDIAERLSLPEVLSNALNTKGLWIIAFTHRREEGRSLLLGALRVALEHDEAQAAMRAYFNLSFERQGVDDYAHDYDRDGLALAERTGDEQWKRSFLLHTSPAALERGDWDEALRITHEAEETPGAESDIFARAILLTRAVVLARRGQVAPARQAIEAAGFDESVGDEQNRAMLWSTRAEVLAAEGSYAEAAAAAHRGAWAAETLWLGHPAVKASIMLETWCALRAGERAPAVAMVERLDREPLGALSPRLRAHRALLCAMLAAPADAGALFPEAVALAREAENPWQLAVALAEQATAGVDRDEALAETRAILGRLGAEAALERLVPDASPARAAAK